MAVYEALWYNGWTNPPSYFTLGGVEGATPDDALQHNLSHLVAEVREIFNLILPDISNEKIQETLYVLREGGLVSVRDVAKRS